MDREHSAQIVPFAPELLPLVRGFSERYWSRPRSDAYYEWRYLRSQPFSRMFLAVQDGECLGMLFALRKPYRIAGRATDCLEVFDWHCLPGEKGTGIGIRLMRAMMRQSEPVLSVGGTPDVHATLPKMGWEHIGTALRFELVIGPDALAERLQHRAGLPPVLTQGPLQLLSAGYFAPRRRRVPSNGLVSPVTVLPAGVRELYRDSGGYGLAAAARPRGAALDHGRFLERALRLPGVRAGRARARLGDDPDLRHRARAGGRHRRDLRAAAGRGALHLDGLRGRHGAAGGAPAAHPRPRQLPGPAGGAAREPLPRRCRPGHPVHLWPKGAWDRAEPLHITLGHSDAPLRPYACEASAGPGSVA